MTAIFDMDGTLYPGDSQLRFARRILKRHGARRLYLLLLVPAGLLRGLRLVSTETLKRVYLSLLWRMPKEELEAECAAFVKDELLPIIHPALRERLEQHRKDGDKTVLCSAAPGWWTRLLGRELKFDISIGTPVETDERMPLLPRITAPGNNRGEKKCERLKALAITRADVLYTDSAADEPLMGICERTVLVDPAPKLAQRHPQAEVLHTGAAGNAASLGFACRCLLGI